MGKIHFHNNKLYIIVRSKFLLTNNIIKLSFIDKTIKISSIKITDIYIFIKSIFNIYIYYYNFKFYIIIKLINNY